jgi:hypothetical protein
MIYGNECIPVTNTANSTKTWASVNASASQYQIVAIGGGASAHAASVVLEFLKEGISTVKWRTYSPSVGSVMDWFGAAGPITSINEKAIVTTHLKGVGSGYCSANLIYRIVL